MAISLREKIYNTIRDDITYGKSSPGERLVESRLVEQFKTSRSPIREALRQLQSEGLITLEQNKGITVAKLSVKEVEEIYNLRWLLESYGARLSAELATKEDIKYLRNLHKNLKNASKTNELMTWLHINTLFHNFFQEHSGNENLNQTLGNLKRRVYRYQYISIRIPGHLDDYNNHHEEILNGCETNDGARAEKYMKLHIRIIKEVLMNYLNNFPAP